MKFKDKPKDCEATRTYNASMSATKRSRKSELKYAFVEEAQDNHVKEHLRTAIGCVAWSRGRLSQCLFKRLESESCSCKAMKFVTPLTQPNKVVCKTVKPKELMISEY